MNKPPETPYSVKESKAQAYVREQKEAYDEISRIKTHANRLATAAEDVHRACEIAQDLAAKSGALHDCSGIDISKWRSALQGACHQVDEEYTAFVDAQLNESDQEAADE